MATPKKTTRSTVVRATKAVSKKKQPVRPHIFQSETFQELLVVSLSLYCYRTILLFCTALRVTGKGIVQILTQATAAVGDAFGAIFLSVTKKTSGVFEVCVAVLEFFITSILYVAYCIRIVLIHFPKQVVRRYRHSYYRPPSRKKLLTLSVDVSLLTKNQVRTQAEMKDCQEGGEEDAIPFVRFELPVHWHKSISSFVLVCLLFLVPFGVIMIRNGLMEKKDTLTSYVSSGMSSIESGKDLLSAEDFQEASQSFQRSLQDFTQARDMLGALNTQLISLAQFMPGKGSSFDDGARIIAAGRNLAEAGLIFSRAAEPLKTTLATSNAYTALESSARVIDEALPLVRDAQKHLDEVEESALPQDVRDTFRRGKESIAILATSMNDASSLSHALVRMLGSQQKKRYLVLFQNNGELRATGGFVGSYALIDVDRGALARVEIPGGGPYDLQGSLSERVIAPRGLHLINTQWQFQDANWFPDFPTSAKKLMWFYEKSGGPSVDGVIAMNASLVTSLIGFTGPISMPAYGKIITQQNFITETQKAVEFEYDKKENKPKKFISDLFPIMLSRVMSVKQEHIPELTKILIGAALSRDIQFYSKEGSVQRTLAAYGVTGEYFANRGDTLLVVNSNVGGGKSDAVIRRTLDRAIVADENGALTETLTLQTEHPGTVGDPLYGVLNVDFIRFYVPKGSVLLAAEGFREPEAARFKAVPPLYTEDEDLGELEQLRSRDALTGMFVHQENGYTVFSQWIQTRPESFSTVKLSYALPFSLRSEEVQTSFQLPVSQLRQSGSNITRVSTSITTHRGTVEEIAPDRSLPQQVYKKSEDFTRDVRKLFHFKSF